MRNLYLSIEGLIKIILLTKFRFVGKFKNPFDKKEVLILGNGPSLLNDLETKVKDSSKYDIFAVNYFANTDLFVKIMPNLYCIAAPELFSNDVEKKYIESSNNLFNNLASKTKWQMNIFVISAARKCERWKNIISNNSNINIIYYNNTAIEGFRSIKYFFWRNNFGLPRSHNVLIPSLMISINLNYRNIYVFGADHSWLKDLSVDENNVALLNQKHFYDYKISTDKPMKYLGKGQRKLHEILHKFYLSFKGYHEINDYAISNNITIYNVTTGSFIDAFPRKNEV